MYYTCILQSIPRPALRYIGSTNNLRRRLTEHNAGKSKYNSRHRPWRIQVYIAFHIRELAKRFETYLKSGSGHNFARRHSR